MTEPYRYFGLAGENHNHDARYPAGDPTAPQDGQVWAYDGASGGWIPKAANAHSHPKLDRALDVETSQRTVYVSPAGSDSAGDGSNLNRWKTVQHAINQAATFLAPSSLTTTYYKVVCAIGTYAEAPVVPSNLFGSFNAVGEGGVWIVSETGVAADVLISSTGQWGVKTFGSATLDKVTIENDTIAALSFGSAAVTTFVVDCVLRRRSVSNGGTAAIYSGAGLVISRNVSSVAGQLFAKGLTARWGGVIGKGLAQPSGSVANEDAALGGVIR